MAAGKGGGGGAIRAGQAFVELLGKDSGLLRALDNAQKRLKAFGQTVATIGAGVAAGGAAILAPIAGLFQAAVDRGTVLDGLARQLGTTVEEVSALGYAFEASGLKQEEFLDVMKTLDQKLSQGLDGKDEAADAFRRLGLSMRDLATASPSERLEKVGAALNGLALASDKTEFAMKLLGGQGGKTLRIFERGPGALKALTDQASEVGAVMSGETAGSAVRVSRAFSEMYAAGKYALLAIGEALLPQAAAIEEFSKGVARTAGALRKWVGENQAVVLGAVGLGAALVAAGVALTTLGLGLTAASTAVGGLITGLVVLKGAVLALATPYALLAAAVAGVGYLFVTQTEAGQVLARTVGEELAGAFGVMRDAAIEAWSGVMSAMKRGDIQAAGAIAMAGLQVVWSQSILTLQTAWAGLMSYLRAACIGTWTALSGGFELMVFGFRESWAMFTGFMAEAFAKSIAAVLAGASSVSGALGQGDRARAYGELAEAIKQGADLDASLAERNHKARLKDFDREFTNRRVEAEVVKNGLDAAADAALTPYRTAVEEARKQLAELVKAQEGRSAPGPGPLPSAGPAMQAVQALARSAKGAFSAPDFRQIFAVGDTVAQRQLRATEQTRDAVKAVEKKLDKLAPPVFED